MAKYGCPQFPNAVKTLAYIWPQENMSWSSNSHLHGLSSDNNVRLTVCIIEGTNITDHLPETSLCVLKTGKQCPPGNYETIMSVYEYKLQIYLCNLYMYEKYFTHHMCQYKYGK